MPTTSTSVSTRYRPISPPVRDLASFTPKERWKKLLQLPSGERHTWDKLSDEAKAIILGSEPSGPPSAPAGERPAQTTHPPERSVNFADLSDEDRYYVYLHSLNLLGDAPSSDGEGHTQPVKSSVPPPFTGDPDGTTLLAHATGQKRFWPKPKGSDLPPSDIRKVLSTGNRRRDDGDKAGPKSKICVDGSKYRLVT